MLSEINIDIRLTDVLEDAVTEPRDLEAILKEGETLLCSYGVWDDIAHSPFREIINFGKKANYIMVNALIGVYGNHIFSWKHFCERTSWYNTDQYLESTK